MDGVFSKVSDSNEYVALSTPSGMEELRDVINKGKQNDLSGGKKRGRKPGSKKMSGGKKSSKKGSKKTSKKGSKKMAGGKRGSKKSSKKTSKKGSKKMSGGKRASKKSSKKTSKKGSKKTSKKGGKRELPEAIKVFGELVALVSKDDDVPMTRPVAMRVASAYKNDLAKDHPNMTPLDVTKKAKKEYSGESTAAKKKYLKEAEEKIVKSKADRKAKKAAQ